MDDLIKAGAVGTDIDDNKTEAPTNKTTLDNADGKGSGDNRLTEAELDFVTFMVQHYNLHGNLMTAELCREKTGIKVKAFNDLMNNKAVRHHLDKRGVPVRDFDLEGDDWRATMLSPRQLIVAEAMIDLVDTRSDKKKLQDLGVSTTQWQAWLSDPVFAKYLQERTEGLLQASQHEASLALLDGVKSGDHKALRLYLEYTKRFVSQADRGQGNLAAEQIRSFIVSIVEIIDEEVHDPATGLRIAERLKRLIGSQNAANAIVASATGVEHEPIEIPEVAAPREQTPEVRALMELGGGNT